MTAPDDIVQIAGRFALIANQFCAAVDSASSLNRTDLLTKLYPILPALIGEAIGLPDISLSDDDDLDDDNLLEKTNPLAPRSRNRMREQEWGLLYNFLKEKLGDWDLYHQVFDPTEDKEAIIGTLADDIADIYRDLKEEIVLNATSPSQPRKAIWLWRESFDSHWGKHAMDALLTIHFRLQNI